MPLNDGRLGVCRVIQKGSRTFGAESILVAATPWIGFHDPSLLEPKLKEVLVLNHHKWKRKPAALWTSYPVPSDFASIGSMPPTRAEERISCNAFGTWDFFPPQVLAQWRWDNDRASVLKEDEERNREKNRRREITMQRRREYLSKVTLKELRVKRRFESWEGCVSDAALKATRKILRDTIGSIIALGAEAPEKSILDRLKWCIKSLNKLDVRYERFIETVEREDLCAEFEEIVHASGLGRYKNLADKWRKW
jgi:hypothetical protein